MFTFHRLLLAAVIALSVCGTARANDESCGGPGQPGCLQWSDCAWKFLGVWCVGGNVNEPPWNGCDSPRLNNYGIFGGCSPCGGTGQWECQYGNKCDAWNNPFGLCYACGAGGQGICWSQPECQEGLRSVFGFCSYSGHSDEPTTNVDNLPSLKQNGSGSDPVRGIADVHNHQFANLGFGGALFWGKPYDARGIDAALAWCDYTRDFTTPVWTPLGYQIHGPTAYQVLTAPVSVFSDEHAHPVGGTGPFDGWPKYNTMTHQQVYHRWLQRAYEGGVRLMVMHAVSNEAICKGSAHRDDWNCDDMPAVDRQLQAVKDLEAAIDRMDNGALDHTGWYQIAYSPQEARQIIRDGKMAVVLGIEVDSLFGCKPGSGCTRDYVRSELARYYQLGVRHLYPIHQFDNAFGGAAIFRDMLNTGNAIVAGEHFTARDCSAEGYNYNIGSDTMIELLGWFQGVGVPPYDTYNAIPADCNARGLTALGSQAISEMMDMKFIIDIDHMSRSMLDSVFILSKARTPKYPLVSGHSTFSDRLGLKTEFSLNGAQLDTMREIGGIVTAPTIPFQSCGTSRQFAENYQYAKGKMANGPYNKAGETGFDGVALATDFGGWGTQLRPRAGTPECTADAGAPLQYPFTGLFGGTFNRQVTGDRIFDFDTDGLAHAGLLPDLFADVKTLGYTDADLNVLYNSAETYIRMWERIDNSPKAGAVTIVPHVTGTLSATGWYTSDVTVTWDLTASDPENNPIVAQAGCDARTIASDTAGLTVACVAVTGTGTSTRVTTGAVYIRRDTTPPVVTTSSTVAPGAWTSSDIGVTFEASDATSGIVGSKTFETRVVTEGANQSVSQTFRDLAGNTTTASLAGLNIDRTPPQITFDFADLPAGATDEQKLAELLQWHNHDVRLAVHATDALSGVAGSPAPALLVLTQEGPAVHGSATATDNVGNSVIVTSFDVKIDRTAPIIALAGRAPAPNAHGWNIADVTVTWTCADALAGPVDATVSKTSAGEGENMSLTGTCADLAGNTAPATVSGIRVDRTNPVVQASAAPAPNPAGWNNTIVTVTFTATDVLSGIDGDAVVDVPITGEGIDLGATRTFVDRAGNEAASSLGGIRIDRTPPTIALASRLPAPNANGWNNTAVTVTWTCADGLSGATVPGVTQTIGQEGAAQSAGGTCVDVAGNIASATVGQINIDWTPPVLTCAPTPAQLWPPNHALVPVAIALGIDGGLSGPGEHVLVAATSSEPDNGLGDGDTAGDIVGFVPGGTALGGALRAERSGRGVGRTYAFQYRGYDRAGNSSVCGTSVGVPRDQGKRTK